MRPSIHNAIADVLKTCERSLSPQEIFEIIIERQLYVFKAQDPLSVVTGQLRRHCKELNFPSARPMKYFSKTDDGRFRLLESPVEVPPSLYPVASKSAEGEPTKLVSVPTDDETAGSNEPATDGPTHSEIQWRLLDLGSQMGLSVWAPHNDRGKNWNGKSLGAVPRLLQRLPIKFDEATTRTIEFIDVLWLDRQSILAGFEVEHTSSIYSGLLRMSDLLTMQPNIDIKLYLTAPDERFEKFAREVARPTFASLRKPLPSLCRFLPYTRLLEKLDEAKNLVRHLKPAFLDDIAVICDPAEDEAE